MNGKLISKSKNGTKAQIVVKGENGGSITFHCLLKHGQWVNKAGTIIKV